MSKSRVHEIRSDAATPLVVNETLHAPDWYDVGTVGFRASGDRAWVLEDEYRSGYECEFCGGKGKVVCDQCAGHGVSPINPEMRCNTCEGAATVTCPQCGGKGGLLVTPDIAKNRPTTGVIVSIGPGVHQNGVWVPTTYREGQHIVYSNFAGYAWDVDGKVIRILHEIEIFGEIKGHLTLRSSRGAKEMPNSQDSFNNSMLDRGKV